MTAYLSAARNLLLVLLVCSAVIDVLPEHSRIRMRVESGMVTLWVWSGTYSAQALVSKLCYTAQTIYLRALGQRYSVWRLVRLTILTSLVVFTLLFGFAASQYTYQCINRPSDQLRKEAVVKVRLMFRDNIPDNWAGYDQMSASYYRRFCLSGNLPLANGYMFSILVTSITSFLSFFLSFLIVRACSRNLTPLKTGLLLISNLIAVYLLASLAVWVLLGMGWINLSLGLLFPDADKLYYYFPMKTENGLVYGSILYSRMRDLLFHADTWKAISSTFFHDLVRVARADFFDIPVAEAAMNWSIAVTIAPAVVTFMLLLLVAVMKSCGLFVNELIHQFVEYVATHTKIQPWTLVTLLLTILTTSLELVVKFMENIGVSS